MLIKKRILIILFCFTGFILMALEKNTPLLLLNMDNQSTLPMKFRTTLDPFLGPDQGLSAVRSSGSSQFSQNSLLAFLEVLPKEHVILVDLREESHGFINGMAVSWWVDHNWGNAGKNFDEIQIDEEQKIKAVSDQYVTMHRKDFTYSVDAQVVQTFTEEELAHALGIKYFRIPVTDHLRPTDQNVDRFIDFVKSLSKDSWLHFHCSAGKGRTTTFMALYDMMYNAYDVSLEDILDRQKLLGGINVSSPNVEATHWKYGYALERSEFLKKFYDYCKQHPHFDISWSEWVGVEKAKAVNPEARIQNSE